MEPNPSTTVTVQDDTVSRRVTALVSGAAPMLPNWGKTAFEPRHVTVSWYDGHQPDVNVSGVKIKKDGTPGIATAYRTWHAFEGSPLDAPEWLAVFVANASRGAL